MTELYFCILMFNCSPIKLPVLVNYVKHNVKVTKQLSQHHSKSAVKTVVRMNKRLGGGGGQIYTKSLFHSSPNHNDKDVNEIRFTTIFLVKLFHYANFLDVFKATKMR